MNIAQAAEAPMDLPAAEPVEEAEPSAPARDKIITPPAEDVTAQDINGIRLQGLNKVTARVSTIEAALGTVMRFGNLEIIARRCWKAPPEEQPENAALLEIREFKPGESPQTVFSGWMFASSPGLSALAHPVYDVTVISCEHLAQPER